MKNLQTVEKRSESDGSAVDVQEVFHTIQGEGPFAGWPAVFVRTAGCNLQCPLCDTDYTSKRSIRTVESVVGDVLHLGGRSTRLVVLTGGEPLRQPLGPLVRRLLAYDYEVQIETNGTLWDATLNPVASLITVVCSPKAALLAPSLVPNIAALKYVARAGMMDQGDGLPSSALDSPARPARPPEGFKGVVYLQPCDEGESAGNALNRAACVESCLKFGYVLCLQLHKLVGLP